jgi:hypothetical protein
MTRLCIVIALLGIATLATADDWSRRGTKGTVTAYELDGSTVIDHRVCMPLRYTWDYVRCGERLREAVKLELCHRLGAGMHHYLYQLGDSRPYRTSVYCARS